MQKNPLLPKPQQNIDVDKMGIQFNNFSYWTQILLEICRTRWDKYIDSQQNQSSSPTFCRSLKILKVLNVGALQPFQSSPIPQPQRNMLITKWVSSSITVVIEQTSCLENAERSPYPNCGKP